MDEQVKGQSDWWREIAGACLALALLFAFFGRDAMLRMYGFKASSEPRQTEADKQPRHALLIIQSVRVQPTKGDGKNWDAPPYALPDLKVSVRNNTTRQRFRTPVMPDTLAATYNSSALFVSAGDELDIAVWDNDVQIDDLVGKITVKITADLLEQHDLDLSFGQVLSLKLQLQPQTRAAQGTRGNVFTAAGPR